MCNAHRLRQLAGLLADEFSQLKLPAVRPGIAPPISRRATTPVSVTR